MRILYTTTVGSTMVFFTDLIEKIIEKSNDIDIATNKELSDVPETYKRLGNKVFNIPWVRSPLHLSNIKAIIELRKILKDGKYDVVHCHTPVCGICTRIACNAIRKKGTKVVYTAHGFHFYKGAPLKNWLLYFPAEWICSFMTDVLITINKEDYEFAKKLMHAKQIVYVPGVGIDIKKFNIDDAAIRREKRFELGIKDDEYLVLSVGELSIRKNHSEVIRAIAKLRDSSIVYCIAGEGSQRDFLNNLIISLGLENRVKLLGQRSDISELCLAADLFVLPSLQEGLPVALMEAIASKTPVICSNIRGNVELVNPGQTFSPYDIESLMNAIKCAKQMPLSDLATIVENNYNNLKVFSIDNVNEIMTGIYINLKEKVSS